MEAQHRCRVCGRGFAHHTSLARHAAIAHGGRLYACALCVFTTSRKDSLQRHTRRFHGQQQPAAAPQLPVLQNQQQPLDEAVEQAPASPDVWACDLDDQELAEACAMVEEDVWACDLDDNELTEVCAAAELMATPIVEAAVPPQHPGIVYAQKLQLKPSSAQMEPVTKSQNESYVVTCITNSSDKGQWTGPRGKVPMSGRVHVEDRGAYGVSLVFDPIEVSDKGSYICRANNEQVNFTLTVIKAPQLKNSPLVQHVRESQTTVIKCEVEGEPKPAITWQKNGVSIQDIPDRKYVRDSMGLKVINATRADAGVFTCSALQTSSGASSIYSWNITLKVQHKPEWKEPGEEVKVFGYLTGETNLTCEAVAEPEANYNWSRVNHSHSHLNRNSMEIREPGRSVLKMYVHNDSYGLYKCEAFNHLGKISRSFSLSPGEKPAPPTGFRLVEGETTVHTATVKVASDTPDLVGYRVQFVVTRPGVDVTWDRPEYQDVAKNDKGHYVIVDLLEDTSYAVRVATRSVAGLSDFTDTYIQLRTMKKGQHSSSWRMVCRPVLVLLSIILQTVH